MKKTFYITLLFALLFSANLMSQDKKTIKASNIKTITVYEEKVNKGKQELIESITVYDKHGNVVEEKEYNNEGKLKNHTKYQFDDFNNKIKETKLDEDGSIIEVVVFKYSNSLKTEKITYDEKNKVINKRRYVYSKFE